MGEAIVASLNDNFITFFLVSIIKLFYFVHYIDMHYIVLVFLRIISAMHYLVCKTSSSVRISCVLGSFK